MLWDPADVRGLVTPSPVQWFLLQLTDETMGEVEAVADMHQRKAEMAKHSDAFIALLALRYALLLWFFIFLERQHCDSIAFIPFNWNSKVTLHKFCEVCVRLKSF
ncbi:hypothetical protein VNO80_25280 [Phaseolus coccineus]|uniref:Uncharacterized protein n=1 Tax=Phaseolus coccineus TaxID=3886 RepID=A0AAN9QNU4_PHACN